MMRPKITAVALALLFAAGCALTHGPASLKSPDVRTVVGANCLTAPIVLRGCDFSKEPPQCRWVTVNYRRSCAEIQVKKNGESENK